MADTLKADDFRSAIAALGARRIDGTPPMLDGPYAESKEMIGGVAVATSVLDPAERTCAGNESAET